MNKTDVLMLDSIGGAYALSSLEKSGLGGSEIEVLQVANGLAQKGHAVTVANGIAAPVVEGGISFVPLGQAAHHRPTRALYLQRHSSPTSRVEVDTSVRVIVRANDVYCDPYHVHDRILRSGRASLVANTQWQADLFSHAKDRIVIPPMLEPAEAVEKVPHLFVYASGPMKGLDVTLKHWRRMKDAYVHMDDCRLAVLSPGWGDFSSVQADTEYDISFEGCPTPAEYRRWIARAEGLFMVLSMPETFCCAAALAERSRTRTHILCLSDQGGIPEALQDSSLVTVNPLDFARDFIDRLGSDWKGAEPRDLRPETLIGDWEETLHLSKPTISVESTFAADPTLRANQEPLDPFFGEFLSLLRGAIAPGGSEFGAGLMLFSLAASIQARMIVEIGRFRGFSTLALAAALRLQRAGWAEPLAARQRPDVDYEKLYQPVGATAMPMPGEVVAEWTKHPLMMFWSVDPSPTPEAADLIERAGLKEFVSFIDRRSEDVEIGGPIDLLFVDGDHTPSGLRSDLQRFVPQVRPGGYFVLHDYFGWFTPDGKNGSPVAEVVAKDLHGCDRVLIDTHYASLVVFRKAQALTEPWEISAEPKRAPARADGRPTVGLVMIAKGDEVSTVATRAVVSAKKLGVDCVSIVADASEAVADVARCLGADVFVRKSPVIDWDKGLGIIGGARNEALDIAERRTDYVLVLDADDWFEGALPEVLDRDAYEVTIQDGASQYSRVQLFRSGMGFRYAGIIHECLELNGSVAQAPTLRYMRGKSSYGYQDQDPPAVKFSKHAKLARKWLFDHPDDARMQFYLARSLHDAGRFDEAIAEYEKRISMPHGWAEERYYAAFQIGQLQVQTQKDPTLAMLRAHEIDPRRAEPLLILARWYRDDARRQFSTAYAFARQAADLPKPNAGLFMVPAVYDYETLSELAICAYWAGKKQEALECFERVLPRVPAGQQRWAAEMIAMCQRELKG